MSASHTRVQAGVDSAQRPRFNLGRLVPFWLLLPSLIMLGIFQLYPTLYTVYISLNRLRAGQFIPVGLNNYTRLLNDGVFWDSMSKSVVFVFFTVTITIGVGMLVASLLNQRSKLNTVYLMLIFVPWVVSDVVVGTIFRWLFQQDYGLVQMWISPLTGDTALYGTPNGAMLIVIVATVWRSLPFIALLLLGALQNVPKDVIESAALDGAGRINLFLRIIFPLISPTFVIGVILSTIGSLNSVGVILTLTGSNPATQTASVYLYENGWQFGDFGLGAATSVVLFAINLVLTLAYLRLRRSE
ncbi:MAG: sugar ABC transporter permease [Anaerolineae bacterium]